MSRFDDPNLLRDELTRRFDLVLRPSAGEIERYRLEAARLVEVLADRETAEREAARGIFLMAPEPSAPAAVLLRTAA